MEYLNIINQNKEKFLSYNNEKFNRFQQLIPNITMRRIVNTIPFLLCVNHKRFPGYIEGDVPTGISNYLLDDDTGKFIQAKFTTKMPQEKMKGDFVQMFAVMGSVGTVAYNKNSDLDYWACIDKNSITTEQLQNFKNKVNLIQQWATKELKVPVHIFINDINDIRDNIFAEDEEEAFGTTVGAVLKDEFYRSSIIIAGKIPFWWVVPTFMKDEEYYELYNKIPEDMKKNDFIDLGNLYNISKEDFLGAALFQIIKSLGNPFKSIIKIGVLEKYLFGKADSPLLSQKVKQHVLLNKVDNSIFDSYLLMFDEVYDYYSQTLPDIKMLQILRQNLYLKINPQLSKYFTIKDKKNIPYKVAVMFQYVSKWNWDRQAILDMDNFDNWDFKRVIKFWDDVKRFMLISYQKISSQFNNLDLQNKISKSDFILLSRKIKTHFSYEPNKIEKLITFKDTPAESILYVEPINEGINEIEWRLFKRNRSEKNIFTTITLKTEKDLVKLLVWTAVNGIYNKNITRINVQSGYQRINQNIVVEMLNEISTFFSNNNKKIKNKYYLNQSFILANCFILNFNDEDSDNFNSLYHVYYTSWGEFYIDFYDKINDLEKVINSLITNGFVAKTRFENYCLIHTSAPHKKISKDFINLIKNAYNHLVYNKNKSGIIAKISSAYLLIQKSKTLNTYQFDNIIKLFNYLSLKPQVSIEYKFSGSSEHISILNRLYSTRLKNGITIGIYTTRKKSYIYTINESGNVFVFYCDPEQVNLYLPIHFGFSIKALSKFKNSKAPHNKIICHKVEYDMRKGPSLTDISNQLYTDYLSKFAHPKFLRVIIDKNLKETPYKFIFPDNTSSNFISIKQLNQIAQKIKSMNINGFDVNHYIGEISFTNMTKSYFAIGTSLSFIEKYKLELLIKRN